MNMIPLVPYMTWILWSTWATWPLDHRGSIIPAPFAEDICEPGPLSSIPFLLLLKLQFVQIGRKLCHIVHVFFATPCDLESSLPRQYNGRVRPKKRVWWPSKWHQLLWIRSIKSVVTIKQDGTPSPPKKGSGSNAGWVQKIPPVMFHPTLRPRRQHIKQSICQYV